MSRPFKVGDRVAVYDLCAVSKKTCRTTGEIIGISQFGAIHFSADIEPPKISVWWVHPKQCRHLKKRERRRVWVREDVVNKSIAVSNGTARTIDWPMDHIRTNPMYGEDEGYIEFVEVRKKK